MLFASMLALGALIGFVGAGGAGVTITLLTVGFHVPIHTALAVALASMVFTMLSGTISHFRQHEVLVKTGAIMGCGGILGAYLGANFSNMLPSNILSAVTGLLLASSAVTLYIKMYQGAWLERHFPVRKELLTGRKRWIYGLSLGVFMGFLSGAFGIGAQDGSFSGMQTSNLPRRLNPSSQRSYSSDRRRGVSVDGGSAKLRCAVCLQAVSKDRCPDSHLRTSCCHCLFPERAVTCRSQQALWSDALSKTVRSAAPSRVLMCQP